MFRALRREKFGFIRLVVNPLPLMQTNTSDRLAAVRQVMAVIGEARLADLAVVIDLHFWSPDGDAQLKAMMADPERQMAYARGVTAMAQALRGREAVALELLNEPPNCPVGKPDWRMLQRQLVANVRAVAPALPVVLTGCGGQLDGLLALDPTPYTGDTNVLYTFHFYEPFIFTHQQTYYGARLRSVPFPALRALKADGVRMMPQQALTRSDTARELVSYLHGNYGLSKVAERINLVTGWARRNRIAPNRILLGEFGTTLATGVEAEAVRADELRWLTVVRAAAERASLAQAYWSLPTKPTNFDFDPTSGFIRRDVLTALGHPTQR